MAAGTSLPQILEQQGILAPRDLERAVAQQKQTGESLTGLLVRLGLVPEQELHRLLGKQMGLRLMSREQLFGALLPADLRRRLPHPRARACVALPLEWRERDKHLSLVVCDPTDERNLEQVRRITGAERMAVSLAPRAVILEAIEAIYANMPNDVAGELIVDGTQSASSGSGDREGLDDAVTSVELIPGKVSVDPSLVREAALSGSLVHSGFVTHSDPDTDPTFEVPDPAEVASARPGPKPSEIMDIGPYRPTLRMKVPWSAEEQEAPPPDARTTPVALVNRQVAATSQVLGTMPPRTPPGPQEVSRREMELDALMWDLLSAIGVLTSMLEERVAPGSTASRECARLSRLVGRSLGMDRLAVARIVAAAQLYALDLALREDAGRATQVDVATVFEATPGTPGGIGPNLRVLGARALGIGHGRAREPAGIQVIRLVAAYLGYRNQAAESDPTVVIERLRLAGTEPRLLNALAQAVEQPAGGG